MALAASEIARIVGGEVVGDSSTEVDRGQPIHHAGRRDLAFAADKFHIRDATDRAGAVVLVSESARETLPQAAACTFVVARDPKLAFVKVMEHMNPAPPRRQVGISPHAFISESARIGRDCNIHACVHIGENAVIGDGCDLHPGVCVGADSVVGNQVVLHPYVVLYPGVRLGDRVIVHASGVIGADGFGYSVVDGRHEPVRHFGDVVIEDDVEVGVGSAIDRSMTGSTRIGEGTKIGNHVDVAHNCELGKHNLLVAQVGFAGCVTTGDYVVCAGQVGVADHVHLGDRAVVAAQAGVAKSLPGDETYFGTPADRMSDARRHLMALRKLPKLRETVRELGREVEQLKQRVADPGDTESPDATDPQPAWRIRAAA